MEMYLFKDKIKTVTIKEIFSIIIILFLIQFVLNELNIIHIDFKYMYLVIIAYILFKLRDCIFSLKQDFLSIFSFETIKNVLFVVILNIFISYGFLYLANFLSANFNLNSLLPFSITYGNMIFIILISPIAEELIFHGVILNRLKLVVPLLFSIFISSLLFAALHSFGSIFSAFIFAVCMAILYLKTDNILVPIFAHFLNNLFAESIVFIDKQEIIFNNVLVMNCISIVAVLSFIIILIFIVKQLNNLKY